MSIVSNFLFFEDIGEIAISNDFAILNGTTLVIEVSGTFTGLQLKINGRVDLSIDQWLSLPILDMNTASMINKITDVGLYRIDITGISTVQADLIAITDGTVKVFGKLIIE